MSPMVKMSWRGRDSRWKPLSRNKKTRRLRIRRRFLFTRLKNCPMIWRSKCTPFLGQTDTETKTGVDNGETDPGRSHQSGAQTRDGKGSECSDPGRGCGKRWRCVQSYAGVVGTVRRQARRGYAAF